MSTKLVLVRHGQSVWNKENRFTGWKDVDLTDQGREEARTAGELLKEAGGNLDEVSDLTELLSEVRAKVEEQQEARPDGLCAAPPSSAVNDAASASVTAVQGDALSGVQISTAPQAVTTIGFGAPSAVESSGFAAPSVTTLPVKNLGVVGRGGAKRIRLE